MYDDECVLDLYMGPVVITNTSKRIFYFENILHTKNKDSYVHNNELHYIPQMVTQK